MIPELKKIISLAVPMILTQLLWMTMPVVDNMMVGQLGAESLAGMALATTYYWLLQLVCLGTLSAINPLISHAFGQGHLHEYRKILHSGLALAAYLSIFMAVMVLIGKSVLLNFGQNRVLVEIAEQYLQAICWGIPFQLGFIVFRQFFDSIENPKPTIVLVICGALLNAGLDYMFIYGKAGIPKLGVAGAGYATALTQTLMCLGLFVYSKCALRYQPLDLWKIPEVKTERIREILRIGIPSSGSMLAEMIYFSGSTFLMGLLGTIAVASHQIALNVASATFMIPLGLSFAISVRVGAFAGRQDWEGVRRARKVGLALCLLLGVLNASVLLIGSSFIVNLYSPDQEIKGLAEKLVKIAGVFQIFDGLQVVGIYILRGLKDTRIPFVITLLSYGGVGMSLSTTLSFGFSKGPVGFWLGMIVALAVAAGLHQMRFQRLMSTGPFLGKIKSTQ